MSSAVSLPAGRVSGQTECFILPHPRTWLLMRVGLVCLLANLALLVLQQVSFRLLAPIIGSSVETWSAIIAVFLAGIALGNVAGGHLADRFRPLSTIRWASLASAVAAVGMLTATEHFKQSHLLDGLNLWVQIVIVSVSVCFLPAFLLSLLTPTAIKAVLRSAGEAGRVAGWIYALGTLGSLVGNYVTGFVLIPNLGVQQIVWIVAGATAAMALLTLGRSRLPGGDLESEATSIQAVRPARQAGRTELAGRLSLACFVVFTCSFVSGSLESAAFRMLAPQVGVSIFLSTGVVGVVLCGMALGNALGGRIGGRLSTLKACLALAGGLTIVVVPILRTLTTYSSLEALPLVPKILLWSFALFFLPSLALGTITPQVIRLLVTDVSDAGRIAGRVYAWSTAGCIVGILATGWSLIEVLGVYRLTVVVGMILLPLALALGKGTLREWFQSNKLLAGGMVAGGLAFAALIDSPYDLETRYFSIAVLDGETEGRPVKKLVLDRLVHSEIDLNDPTWLGYKYEVVQSQFVRALSQRPSRMLIIGGGGYTLPKWITGQRELDHIQVDVVEIDSGVTEIAHRALGMPRDTRVMSYNLDGRQFVKQSFPATYDLIAQDAVNDYSVPYHLMTREYNDLIRRSLSDDGVYLVAVIDSLTEGPFLRAAVRTLQQSFAEVRLLAPTNDWENRERCVYILAAFHSADRASRMLGQIAEGEAFVLPPERLAEMLARDGGRGVVLTDDYAPVDTLMTRVYLGDR